MKQCKKVLLICIFFNFLYLFSSVKSNNNFEISHNPEMNEHSKQMFGKKIIANIKERYQFGYLKLKVKT